MDSADEKQKQAEAAKELNKVAFCLFVHAFCYASSKRRAFALEKLWFVVIVAVPALVLKLYNQNSQDSALFTGFANGGAAFLQFFCNAAMGYAPNVAPVA
jgi:hypothetical protein